MKKVFALLMIVAFALVAIPAVTMAEDEQAKADKGMKSLSEKMGFTKVSDYFASLGKNDVEKEKVKAERQAKRDAKKAEKKAKKAQKDANKEAKGLEKDVNKAAKDAGKEAEKAGEGLQKGLNNAMENLKK